MPTQSAVRSSAHYLRVRSCSEQLQHRAYSLVSGVDEHLLRDEPLDERASLSPCPLETCASSVENALQRSPIANIEEHVGGAALIGGSDEGPQRFMP